MDDIIYLTHLSPWWTLALQQKVLQATIEQGHPVHEEPPGASMATRREMWSELGLSRTRVVHVASLAVLAATERELLDIVGEMVAKVSVVAAADVMRSYRPGHDVDGLITDWKAARQNARLKVAATLGGQARANKVEAENRARVKEHAAKWGDAAHTATSVLALMGVSRNTANKYMKMTWEQAAAKRQRAADRAARAKSKESVDA